MIREETEMATRKYQFIYHPAIMLFSEDDVNGIHKPKTDIDIMICGIIVVKN